MNRGDMAIAAAQGAATGAAELLRFAREGEITHNFAVEPETIEQLADALKMTIEIELPAAERRGDMVDELRQLQAAIATFIEDWA